MSKKQVGKTKKDTFFLGMILLCVVLIAFGVWMVKYCIDTRNENAHLREICTEETAGTVVGYHETGKYSVNDKNEVTDTRQDYPIYEYEADGRTYSVQSERYDSKGKLRYKLGERITVRYAPGDPEKHFLPGEVGDVTRNVWIGIGFGVFLILFFGFAIFKLSREYR